MQYVDDVLNAKGRDVYTATPTTTVFEALELMADKEVGALVVVDKDRLVGIVSERDYARRLALEGKRSRETSVSEIMTDVVATISQADSMKDCMERMTNQRVRHLPVLEDDRLIGLISIGDVVKSIMFLVISLLEVKQYWQLLLHQMLKPLIVINLLYIRLTFMVFLLNL